MSDTGSNADSISDSSNAHHVDVDGGAEAIISSAIRELCSQLRANDPRILRHSSTFRLYDYLRGSSEAECIEVFQALKENTSVKHIRFSMLFQRHCNGRRSALAAAEHVESSKTLQTLDLGYQNSRQVGDTISLLLRALSRNTSVTKVIIKHETIRFASVAFQELLTCTQTLQKLDIIGSSDRFDEVQTAAIAAGFASNTTLRDLEFSRWQEADLTPVLTALHCHPALEKIHFNGKRLGYLPSLSGLEVLLRGQDSKVKELILEQVDTRTVGLHRFLRELERNTTVTNLAIRKSG
jgi:hypothetical protein